MNYCIIMPRLARDNDASYAFPIGMAYVSSALKVTGRHVITYNLNYKRGTTKELLSQLIETHDINVIASGGLTIQYQELHEIFKLAKEIKPSITTWVGGGIITASPIPAMEALQYADYGMVGEGEVTICELADAMEGKRSFDSVDGLIYRSTDGTGWHLTAPRSEIEDLDSLPFPDYEGFEYEKLLSKVDFELSGEDCGMVSFSRSCPFNCTFCFHPSGTKYRKRSLTSILSEIDYLIDKYNIKSLYVSDELFSLRGDDFDAFCGAMKQRKLSYMVALRVDMVTPEIIHKLKSSGCRYAGFGLESADNSILKSMRKHITIEQIEYALDLCHKENLHAQGNFIFGDEAETVETYHNTLNWWKLHPQYTIKLSYISVYPGSILYQNACKNGIITDEVEYIRQGCPQINVSKLTEEEYRQMMLDISVAINRGTDQLTDGKVEYYRSGHGTLSGTCPHCGHYNVWKDIEVFRPIGKTICVHCNSLVDIFPADYIDRTLFSKHFKQVCQNRVGIWGIINPVEILHEMFPDCWNEPFYLIDSAAKKQGLSLYGKPIFGPEIVKEQSLDTIIITFTSVSAGSITHIIEEQFPSVNRIFFLGDLLNPEHN